MGAFRVGTRPGEFVLALFGKASAERVVAYVQISVLPAGFLISARTSWFSKSYW